MITVFGAPPTRALRVVWMLEEMGLPYEIRKVDFANRFKDEEFITLNPAGFVPAIKDGEAGMFESCAIMEYLGDKYGPTPLVPAKDAPNRALYLQFLHFGEASLAGPLNVTMMSRFFAPDGEKMNFGAKAAIDMAVNRSKALVQQLNKTPYIAGDAFTAADISVSYFLNFRNLFEFADRLDPVILEYYGRLTERPAYKRAEAKDQRGLG